MKRIPFYTLLFLGLLGISCGTEAQTQATAPVVENATEMAAPTVISEVLNPADFAAKLATSPAAQLIDVRTPPEVAAGSLASATNIDFRGADFASKAKQLDPSKPVFVYCAGGHRSAAAAKAMQELGFSEIYDLEGGFSAWKAQGMDFVKN